MIGDNEVNCTDFFHFLFSLRTADFCFVFHASYYYYFSFNWLMLLVFDWAYGQVIGLKANGPFAVVCFDLYICCSMF